MNQVSWLIYFAGVSGNLGDLLVFLGIVALCAGVAFLVISFCDMDNINRWADDEEKNKWMNVAKKRRGVAIFYGCFVSGFFWILAAFTPSQNTVLAIAASQVGEQILQSKTVNLAEQALDAWLKRQINPPKPADSDSK